MLDLTSLSFDSQKTLTFLLLLPVGALITAVLNGIIGLRIVGVFSPTILALNQARSDWRVGIIVFAITFIFGSVGRKLLARSKLSRITRRGIISTVTVAVFAVMIVINEKMQLGMKAGTVVLPVVILTLIIDRFFGIIEKEGNRAAMIILSNTILVAVCCFIVFAYTPVDITLLKYPLLELAVIGGLIFIGTKVKNPVFTFPAKTIESNKKADNND